MNWDGWKLVYEDDEWESQFYENGELSFVFPCPIHSEHWSVDQCFLEGDGSDEFWVRRIGDKEEQFICASDFNNWIDELAVSLSQWAIVRPNSFTYGTIFEQTFWEVTDRTKLIRELTRANVSTPTGYKQNFLDFVGHDKITYLYFWTRGWHDYIPGSR